MPEPATKKRKKSKAPSYRNMAEAAIIAIKLDKPSKGASLAAIKSFIGANFDVQFKAHLLRSALKAGCSQGRFAVHHVHRGSYKLGKVLKSKVAAKAEAKASADGKKTWRDTLFFWRGELRYASPASDEPGVSRRHQEGVLVWKGSWVGTDSLNLPSDAAFNKSTNTFELRAKFPGGVGLDHVPATPEECSAFFGLFKGEYLLEGEQTQDKKHKFRTACLSTAADMDDKNNAPVATVVTASGDTKFGRFISLGTITRRGGADAPVAKNGAGGGPCQLRVPAAPGERAIVMTLARRYVTKHDVRSAWKDPREIDLAAVLPTPELAAKPWKALSVHYKARRARKKKKQGGNRLVEWGVSHVGMPPPIGGKRHANGPIAWNCSNCWS